MLYWYGKERSSGIYGPINDENNWRIRTNQERRELNQEESIVVNIDGQDGRVTWKGWLRRENEKKVYREKPEGRRKVGRSRKMWLDGVEEDLNSMRVVGWKRKTRDGSEWRKVIREAKVLQGL